MEYKYMDNKDVAKEWFEIADAEFQQIYYF